MTTSEEYWVCRDRRLQLGSKTRVMGILNVTPDSFSDGGCYADASQAVERALQMLKEGADIIDIGGESTRPGASPVSAAEEIKRTLPVIEALVAESCALISIDTMKHETARCALEAGAHIINDVSAGTRDPRMADLATEYGAGLVLMHMRGEPRTMQENPIYEDVVQDVCNYLAERRDHFLAAGVAESQVVLDPGIGFGKTIEHNLELLRKTSDLAALGHPVLIGASRKSLLGNLLDLELGERQAASLGIAAYCAMRSVDILRVHDVKDTCHVTAIIDILRRHDRA